MLPDNPHFNLLKAGWECDTKTSLYRQPPDGPWVTLDAARVLAFGPPEPMSEQSSGEPEPSIIELLKDIRASVQAIEQAVKGRFTV